MSESQTEIDTQPTPERRTRSKGSESTTIGEFTLIVGVAVAVALGMSFWMRGNAPPSSGNAGLEVGQLAPEITATYWINGRPESANGRIRVIHGWFPGCPYCWQEAPELVELHEKFGDRVQFIGLSPDGDDLRAEHLAFVEKNAIDWPNGYGALDTLRAFRATAFPVVWVIDANGRIVWNSDSMSQGLTLEQGIDRALAKSSG